MKMIVYKKKSNTGISNLMEKKRGLGGRSHFYTMIILLRGRALDKNDIGKRSSFTVQKHRFFFSSMRQLCP